MATARRPPVTMYSLSTGTFRAALDRLLADMEAATKVRNVVEQRRLAIVAETIARRWCDGATQDELADQLAREIDS